MLFRSVNGAWNFGTPLGVTDAAGNVSFKTSQNYAEQFVAWNPTALSFNLMLKPLSVAIGPGMGAPTVPAVPTVDILGVKRAAPYAVGAYSYPR